MKLLPRILCVCVVFALAQVSFAAEWTRLEVLPASAHLRGTSEQQLIVTGYQDSRAADLTRDVVYVSGDPAVVRVVGHGLLEPVGDGRTTVVIEAGGQKAEVAVTVTDAGRPRPVDFERDVLPIFTRYGCNAGACHGKARGQNGFALSLLAFDADFDYEALAHEARGRRVFLPVPEQSLLLQKPTGESPHGGGKRLDADSTQYRVLLQWIREGMPRSQPDTPELVKVTVEPSERIMRHETQQQLLVTAHYSDGSTEDVTRLAAYQSNESAVAAVDEHGLITAGTITGEAAVMARYRNTIAVCNVPVPLEGDVSPETYAALPRYNFIDEHVWAKLERLGLLPSDPCEDHTFVRRVYLDIIGRVPTVEEVRAFLDDDSADKRVRLVDHLLEQPEFANHWANKWADLLRPNPYRVGIKAVLNYDDWIRDAFRENKSYDQFVKELITAQGSTFRNGAVTMFRDRRSPDELTTIVSQLFLGIRLECAKCHHHPFEVWSQEDYYSFAAYFARVGRKGTGLSPPISGSEEIVYTSDRGSVSHPLTGKTLEPRPLFGTAPAVTAEEDPRKSLAAWIASPENPFFEQTMANRVWADLMGRGVVEPVDDLRATNPPTNGPLLEALGADFREHGYDIKHLIRRIATSYVYQLSSLPNERNVADTQNYSRHYRQRLRAEVLLDAVCGITGIPESFDAMPPESKAKELWTHRVGSLFLDAFGRPDPNQDPPCERTSDTTVVQALHLMNSENLYRKVTHDEGLAAELAKSERTASDIAGELYLAVYARPPSAEEVRVATEFIESKGSDRRKAVEDLLWALLNTPEFVFKD